MLKVFRITAVVLLLLWMILIFCLSDQDSSRSSATSGSVITVVVKIFHPDFDELSAAEQEALIQPFQFVFRKGAHFTAYAVLSIFSFLSVITYLKISFSFRCVISAVICLLYAISDEIHQLYVPGRSGEIRDVLIDFCGSLAALLIMILIAKCTKLKKFIKGGA